MWGFSFNRNEQGKVIQTAGGKTNENEEKFSFNAFYPLQLILSH
jgi:hypothetical protein